MGNALVTAASADLPSLHRIPVFDSLAASYELGFHRQDEKDSECDRIRQAQQVRTRQLRISLRTDLTEPVRRAFQVGKHHCNLARTEAEKKNPLEALRQLAIAERSFLAIQYPAEAQGMAQSELASATAAVEYQAGRFSDSERWLDVACSLDKALYEQTGDEAALAKGYHLLGKRVQLLTALGREEEATACAVDSLLALANGSMPLKGPCWPIHPSPCFLEPWEMRALLARQLVVELAAAQLSHSAPYARAALARHCLRIEQAMPSLPLDPFARAFLQAKIEDADHRSGFLALPSYAQALQHRRQENATLWMLVALDAARILDEDPLPESAPLRARIYADLAAHSAFPATRRRAWQRISSNLSSNSSPRRS